MYKPEPDKGEEFIGVLRSLAKKPRKISLISSMDGNSYDFLDDGGSIIQNEGFRPNPRRTNLINAIGKKTRDGHPVFYSGERFIDNEDPSADISYTPTSVEPVYPGDPVGEIPPIDTRAIERIGNNVRVRAELKEKQTMSNAKDITEVLSMVATKMKHDAAKIEKPARKKKEAEASV